MRTNVFYHGDCLFVMKNEYDIPSECIDLIYLDPPFFTGKVQKNKSEWTPDLITFDDSYTFWEKQKIREDAPLWLQGIAVMNKILARYLYYMRERLQQCYKVLKPTGSIYLHCDYRASHYLKVIMDEIFGYDNLQREITWDTSPLNIAGFKTQANNWIRAHDTLFFYTKDQNNFTFNKQWKERYKKEQFFKYEDEGGKYGIKTTGEKIYIHEDKGEPVSDVWKDILSFNYVVAAKESVRYPTQKPLSLLKRIIKASSDEGDIVLDPFCGCGTTVIAAHKLARKWIGIDINNQAFVVIKKRLNDSELTQGNLYYNIPYPEIIKRTEGIIDIQQEIMGMKPKEFENWVNEFYKAKRYVLQDGSDGGVDGITPDGVPIQTKTTPPVKYDIVTRLKGDAEIHPNVPQPLRVIRVVSQNGFDDSAFSAQAQIQSKFPKIKVELIEPKDIFPKEKE